MHRIYLINKHMKINQLHVFVQNKFPIYSGFGTLERIMVFKTINFS